MKLLANLGDADPLQYGGLLVIERDGDHCIEVWDEPDSDEKVTVYQVPIDKFTYVDGVLSDNPYHPDLPVWFADNLPRIARFVDTTRGELIERFTSDDPVQRARGYEAVASHYGWNEFDQYPLTMSVEAAARRYQAFDLGPVAFRYQLLDQIRAYCQEQLNRLDKYSEPDKEAYWQGQINGERGALYDVLAELKCIEVSWS